MKIVTHDGTFHADELVAIALLKKFVVPNNTEVIRTRDELKLKEYLVDKSVFVIDVGREFNEKNKNFDHHHRSFNEKWDDGVVLSSCGLVWRHIKRRGYLKKYNYKSIRNMEEKIIKRIDLHDNGFGRWPLATMFSICNRENSTYEDFNKALDMAKVYVENIFYQERVNEKNEVIFKNDLKKYDGGEIFFSQISIKNGFLLKKLANETKTLVFIHPSQEYDEDERWYAKSIKRLDDDYDEISALVPQNFRGLSNKRLVEYSGVKGAIFVHRAGHMAVCKTKKAAIKMANLMIEDYHDNHDFLE
jgi:uncharacterized UPF0160 family protein